MRNEYDYNIALEREAMRYKKTYNTHKVLYTSAAWRENANGSAECASVRMSSIYEAYEESRSYEW
jgi:hypothetical protein